MKVIKGTDKGFFAVSNDTARQISQCIDKKEEWFVKWGNETLYYDSTYGDNVWEYYFKQIYDLKEHAQVVQDYTELILLKDNSFRSTMNYIYKNYFILNAATEEKLAPSYKLFEEKNILGVHIRRTDKFLIGMYGTTQKHAPVDLELFKVEIDKIVDNYDYIYLATDCMDAVKYIKKQYGKKLIYNINAIRGNSTRSIHNNFKDVSGYVKGLNVLTDVIFLSKCTHLIRSSSNVSITSLYLNLNLTHLNVNEKYLNDSEKEIL
jgi:hypothetical protein